MPPTQVMLISSLKTREYGGIVGGRNNNFPTTGIKKEYVVSGGKSSFLLSTSDTSEQ